MPFLPLKAQDLRIGLYINLSGSWLRHPFASNTFKITSSKDLATLRTLRKVEILYDPEQSDPESLPDTQPEEPTDQGQASQAHPEAFLHEIPEASGATVSLKEERTLAFETRRQKLIEAEKVYKEVVRENKIMVQEVKAGYIRGMRKAEELVTSLEDVLGSDGTLVALMNLMESNETGEDYYYHSLNVSILSMAIGQALGLPKADIRMLGLGALFHDFGELDGANKLMPNSPSRTRDQREALRKHPEKGCQMVERGFDFPGPSLRVIHQHHERLNGSGYPQGLKETAITPFAKIVMVVETYEEWCNNPDLEKSLTPYEALCNIYAKREIEFWEEAIVALIRNLGVYPPSTLVQLTDGSIGVVCSINLLDRMRPTVMMYAPDIPRNEAVIVALAQENELSIKESLRPKDVEKRIWNYLNPRRMISYFPLSPEKTPS